MGVTLLQDEETNTYAYAMDGSIVMQGLPDYCLPMLEKSYDNLVSIRRKDEQEEKKKH